LISRNAHLVHLNWYRISFAFSTSSPEPLGQIYSKLAQITLRQTGFRIVQMKDNPIPKGDDSKMVKSY
jgi:hypothetical protein